MVMVGDVDVILIGNGYDFSGNDVTESELQVDCIPHTDFSCHYFLTFELAIPERPLILPFLVACWDIVPFGPLTVLPDFAIPAAWVGIRSPYRGTRPLLTGYLVCLCVEQCSFGLYVLRMVPQVSFTQVRTNFTVAGRLPLAMAFLPLRLISDDGFDHLDKGIFHSCGIRVLQTAHDSFCHIRSGFQLYTL